MKVIFLDIDGVMNFVSSEAAAPSGRLGVVDKKISLLSDIIKTTNAKIVLLQSWSKEWNRDIDKCTNDGKYLDRKMIRRGIHILDKIETNIMNGVGEWLNKNNHVTNAIIMSSELCDIFVSKECKTEMHSLLINPDTGLTSEDVGLAIDLLGV